MINLIPRAAKKKITLEYWLRVWSSWAYLWAVTLLVGICFLIPAYVLIDIQVKVYEDSARVAEESVADYENVSKNLRDASRQAVVVLNETDKNLMYEYVSLFNSLDGEGVVLADLRLVRAEEGLEEVVLNGEADDRATLAAFRDRLLAEPSVSEVDLPISNLAKDRDIQFNLTVTMNNDVSL